MKYVVCYSGGHSSALVALEAVRRYGKDNVILLNHNISPKIEHADIKRFKRDVADCLDLPITYANMDGWQDKGPLDVCMEIQAFKVGNGTALCTNRLKTEPFNKWLKENYPSNPLEPRKDITILYGFDKNEKIRIQRRVGVMATQGYAIDCPLAFWERTIANIEEIGIQRPVTYKIFKHANCIGCLKAGRQHWYIVYCLCPHIFEEAKEAERKIGYSIIKDVYLEELEPKYEEMKAMGVCPNDKEQSQTFWARVNACWPEQINMLPCECSI